MDQGEEEHIKTEQNELELDHLSHKLQEVEEEVYHLEGLLKLKITERKYRKAQQIKDKLQELKTFYRQKKREVLAIEHERANSMYNDAQEREYEEFQIYWNEKMNSFEIEVQNILREINEKQEKDLRDFIDGLEAILPHKVNLAPELIKLRQKEKNLANIGEYLEAEKVKKKSQKIEDSLILKLETVREGIADKNISQFMKKQKKEKQVLEMKIESKRKEFQKQKNIEFSRLNNKYRNVRKEMELIQGLEKSKLSVMEKKSVSIKHIDSLEDKNSTLLSGVFGLASKNNINKLSSSMRNNIPEYDNSNGKPWKEKILKNKTSKKKLVKIGNDYHVGPITDYDLKPSKIDPNKYIKQLQKKKKKKEKQDKRKPTTKHKSRYKKPQVISWRDSMKKRSTNQNTYGSSHNDIKPDNRSYEEGGEEQGYGEEEYYQ